MEENIFRLLNEGHWLHAGAGDCPEVSVRLHRCADLCFEINSLPPSNVQKRDDLLRKLLGSAGNNLVINPPFRCDFGYNILIGHNFVGNFNLTILDEGTVTIGDNVLIGPNCTLATINHAMLAEQRSRGIMQAKPIAIGNNVWLASNVVVLPGVSIGDGSVIGAGSVVTKSIPPNVFAAGNPCTVRRPISESRDRIEPII